ncbi:MAG: hypothetical protein ACP5NK_02835 [Thermoplasmata archaeon]
MSKLLVALVILMISSTLMFSQVSFGSESENEISLADFPQITINVTNSVDVNLTYWAMVLSTPQGPVGSQFEKMNWTVSNVSDTYSYESSFSLTPVSGTDLGDFYGKYINAGSSADQSKGAVAAIPARAYVNISHYLGPVSSLSIFNATQSSNYKFSGINTSTLKASFSLVFTAPQNSTINNYSLFLIQAIKASENAQQLNYSSIEARGANETYGGVAMQTGTGNNTTKALYWWGNDFQYNNSIIASNVTSITREEGRYVIFNFTFHTSGGVSVVTQDPYISVNGISLVGNRITVYGEKIASFLLEHVEFTVGGFALGVVFLFGLYARHKKPKIRF